MSPVMRGNLTWVWGGPTTCPLPYLFCPLDTILTNRGKAGHSLGRSATRPDAKAPELLPTPLLPTVL